MDDARCMICDSPLSRENCPACLGRGVDLNNHPCENCDGYGFIVRCLTCLPEVPHEPTS